MKKLNCILLVDDDEPTNFLHKLIIKRADCAEHIITLQSGAEALEYLQKEHSEEHPRPELIFMDINMPVMNGWEFLDAYKEIQKNDTKPAIIIVLLSASVNPDDKDEARKVSELSDFKSKPLNPQTLQEILDKYFS